MKRSRRNLLLGCGALLLLVLCVGIGLTFSGVGALAAIFGPDPQGLAVDVAVEPVQVTSGETFRLNVQLRNVGSRVLNIDSLSLPEEVMAGALLKGVTPADQDRSELGGATIFTIPLEIPPGESARVTFEFQALESGDYSGDLQVAVGLRRKLTPLRVVVAPPQATPPSPETQLDPATLNVPYRAVVQIRAMVEEDGQLVQSWTGSGSIVSSDGLILTNAHVVLPDKYYPVDALIVALTEAEDQPPVPTFFAEVMQADEALDIAVIRITTDMDGAAVDFQALDLPVVPLGDSDRLSLGDRMYILGYPGIGGETITLTSGEVSGFTAEAGRGERAFIKTSATIAGGNSGGLAANADGELIGVPTQLGYGGDDQFIDCRVLADTNRDGVVDDEDSCVPTGGFINALRPLELARPLIEAAQRGEVAVQGDTEAEAAPAGGGVLYADDFSDPESGWDIARESDYAVGYEDGAYVIEVQADDYFVWSVAGAEFRDQLISVWADPEMLTGEGDFGVICRYQDGDNFYALEVSEDGFYSIWKREAGDFVPLVEWEFTDSLPLDGSPVEIQAACVGDTLSLAADGLLLAETRDGTFAQGDVGLIAGTWETPGLVMAFDDYLVLEP